MAYQRKSIDQTIFDRVVKHLYKQNKKASNRYGTCLYRAPNGLKCAVGCLITDKNYAPWLDSGGSISVSSTHVLKVVKNSLRRPFSDRTPGLLRALQHLHDTDDFYVGNKAVEKQLRNIAADHHLNTDVIQTVS